MATSLPLREVVSNRSVIREAARGIRQSVASSASNVAARAVTATAAGRGDRSVVSSAMAFGYVFVAIVLETSLGDRDRALLRPPPPGPR
jgi:hypothetical protein